MTQKWNDKRIKSLQLKKYRQQEQCFVVEGWKPVEVLIRSDFDIVLIIATDSYLEPVRELIKVTNRSLSAGLHQSKPDVLAKLGSFQSNDSVLAVARIKPEKQPVLGSGLILALDDIRDPGNFGTIIRTADWFGVRTVVASKKCVDFYNPKVISSSMGSFCHVDVIYTDLFTLLKDYRTELYGAFLSGVPLNQAQIRRNGIIVIGNESNGISSELKELIPHQITIPGYGHAESLNAAVSAGILLYAASLNRK